MSGKRSDEQFDYLTVKDNVIDTGTRTISIRNISTIGIEKIYPLRRLSIICASVAIFMAIVGALNAASPQAEWNSDTFSGVLLTISAIIVFFAARFYFDSQIFLAISTNNGSHSLFYNDKIEFLKRVKSTIDDRINNPADASQFTVNFNKGSIEQMSVDNMGGVSNMSAETVVSDSPGARVASHSPSAQVGDGNTMELTTSYVNYETYLPHVEKIRQAVPARRPDLNIEDKLDELIDLMRQSSPTREDKSRVEQLALNLAQVLQAYPPMVRLFSDIAGVVGRFL
jgi:hypothetical protein